MVVRGEAELAVARVVAGKGVVTLERRAEGMGVVMAAAAVATEKEEVEMELVVVMAGSAGVGELTGQEAAVTAMVEEAAVVGMIPRRKWRTGC